MSVIAGVVILYYPEVNVVFNIQSYCNAVKKVFVIDNSEERNKEVVQEISKIPNVAYFHDGENKGIAIRLNQASEIARKEGFDWLLTMDQDSNFSTEDMQAYLQCFAQHQDKQAVAMFGVEYEKPLTGNPACMVEALNQLITSGSLLNLEIWPVVGGFNQSLFIDEVDLEYCYKSIVAGFKILKFNNVFLNHTLGKVSFHYSLKTLTLTPRTLHGPLRIYYMVRNHLYITGKYYRYFSKDIIRSRNDIAIRIKNNLIYGKNRWLLIKLIFQAVVDYKMGKMGKKVLR